MYKNKALSDEWHLNSNYQSLRSSKRQSSQVGICWRWRVSEPISYQIWYNSLAPSKAELLCKATGSCGCKLWEKKNEILGFSDQLCAGRTNFKSFFCFLFLLFKKVQWNDLFPFWFAYPMCTCKQHGNFFWSPTHFKCYLHCLHLFFLNNFPPFIHFINIF